MINDKNIWAEQLVRINKVRTALKFGIYVDDSPSGIVLVRLGNFLPF